MGASALVSDDEVDAFQRDGVVCLRGLFDTAWVEHSRKAMDRIIANPTDEGTLINPAGPPGRFERDLFMWMSDDDFKALALESPVGEIAARCMKSERVNLLADMMLTKEPHTPAISPWHHDLPYNWVDGSKVCGMWLSLDYATAERGAAEWIRGSHKWGRMFATRPFDGGAYQVDDGLEPMPDIDADRASYDIVQYETEPGDCIVNHLKTVHWAPGNHSERRRRAVVYRLSGDDAVYVERGPGRPKPKYNPELEPGSPIPEGHDQFPLIWPRNGGAS